MSAHLALAVGAPAVLAAVAVLFAPGWRRRRARHRRAVRAVERLTASRDADAVLWCGIEDLLNGREGDHA